MDIFTILFIAVGLSMDAFAVSVTSGFTIKRLHINNALKIAVFFGMFQAIMPVLGWAAGLGFRGFISGVDHWIAFGLLSIIGVKMIFESRAMDSGKTNRSFEYLSLLILSVATSIDALAVGLSLSLLSVSIISPSVIIGITTFLFPLRCLLAKGRAFLKED